MPSDKTAFQLRWDRSQRQRSDPANRVGAICKVTIALRLPLLIRRGIPGSLRDTVNLSEPRTDPVQWGRRRRLVLSFSFLFLFTGLYMPRKSGRETARNRNGGCPTIGGAAPAGPGRQMQPGHQPRLESPLHPVWSGWTRQIEVQSHLRAAH